MSSGSSDPAVVSPIKAHANGTDDGKPGVVLLKNDNQRWANLVRRAVWTVVLVGGFVALVAAGHVYLMAMVFAIQASAFFEIVRIAHEPGKDRKVPYIWGLNWYVFFVANYFLYGEHLLRFFEDETYLDAFALLLAQHHLFICYTLYIIGAPPPLAAIASSLPRRPAPARHRRLCAIAEKGPVQVSVWPAGVVAHGHPLCGGAAQLYHQQHYGGHRVVPAARLPRHLQRHYGVHLGL